MKQESGRKLKDIGNMSIFIDLPFNVERKFSVRLQPLMLLPKGAGPAGNRSPLKTEAR
tara:strand:+ start:135 stop:308 length:174 start_codon:yes stop_codon:yes gene_type:complete